MPIAHIAKEFSFHAAHQLPNHDGKCRKLHGHTYKVRLMLAGEIRGRDGSSSEGMVVDFDDVKKAWEPIHNLVDHSFLNDTIPGDYQPTTAENIARFIRDRLAPLLEGLVSVRVWETTTSSAEVCV